MVWPVGRLGEQLPVILPTGYVMRMWTQADMEAYLALMKSAGFEFTREVVQGFLSGILPDGFFVVVQAGRLVATAMATHAPAELHPYGGALGWVAAAPDHSGKGLGLAVCSAVINRLTSAGYRRIYLRTDDHRLPALWTYLKMGFVPLLYLPDMKPRWLEVFRQLNLHADTDTWLLPGD